MSNYSKQCFLHKSTYTLSLSLTNKIGFKYMLEVRRYMRCHNMQTLTPIGSHGISLFSLKCKISPCIIRTIIIANL